MKHAPGPAIGVKGYVNTQDVIKMVRVSATGSKHMGLWRGHVGHVQLVWFVDYVCVHTIRSHLGGVNIGVNSMGSSDKP